VLLRLLVSTDVFAAMAATTLVSAYRAMRNAVPYEDLHRTAFMDIGRIKHVLEKTYKEKERHPGSLAELNDPLDDYLHPHHSGQYLDPWGHPYEYHSDEQSYALRSLGIDGKPGGPGLARDVDALEVSPQQDGAIEFPRSGYFGRPTFRQYAFNLDSTKPVKIACALAGAFAAVASFVTLGYRSSRR
jgi:hypothetical protein